MMRITCSFLYVALSITSFSASSASVNPFTYGEHESAILKAKWQLGKPSSDVCKNSACESALNNTTNDNYLYADNGTKHMYFSTSGSKARLWRSELRYEDSFSKSQTKSMSVRVKQYSSGTSSSAFTVAQLHMEDSVGPPARLEYIDGEMLVTFRTDDGCTSNCWIDEHFNNANVNVWQYATLQLSNYYVNVSVGDETKSFKLSSAWPDNGAYYWKAGVYLQEAGTALVGFDYINW